MVEKEQGTANRADEAVPRDNAAFTDAPMPAITASGQASAEEAEHERIMAIAREVMRDHREVLAALAK